MPNSIESTRQVLARLSLYDSQCGVKLRDVNMTFNNEPAVRMWLKDQDGHPFLYYTLDSVVPLPTEEPDPEPDVPDFEALVDVQGRIKFTRSDGLVRYGQCPEWIPVGTILGDIS